jgi:8-oxo-dGTP pyrophosphatase MutT (NUDIX family)
LRAPARGEAAAVEPEYACGLIADPRGWWLLQLRPSDQRIAPGLLTCFGGRREPGESAEACLRRELAEELGWCPASLTPTVELWKAERFIARFYRGPLDVPLARLRLEPGQAAILASPLTLPGLPVSPWHAAVFAAMQRGDRRAEIPTRSPGA